MNPIETFLILLTAICGAIILAKKIAMPTPIAFVMVGLGLAFIPGFPAFNIPPQYMLLIFLPVLLAEAAYFTSVRDFRVNMRWILMLAVGLVGFTAVVVAVVMNKIIPGFGWAAGLVLGAIISPPDAVAATSIAKNIKIPKRAQTILEGESLVNDAAGLVIYKFAVLAVVTQQFSMVDASLSFSWMVVCGLALGWLIGFIFMRIFTKLNDPSVQILGTFLAPYAAYILAEHVHASGVLAVVVTGLMVSWHGASRFTSDFRVAAEATWKMVVFVMNGLVFMLIGLQFPSLLQNMADYSPTFLLTTAFIVSLTVVLVRFLWVYGVAYGVRFLFKPVRKVAPCPPWQNVFIVAWTGMRGVVSLATALALPMLTLNDVAFPHRDLIIFISFSVILFTLVLQGLSLPWILRKLSVVHDWRVLHEDWMARKDAAQAVLQRLDEMPKEGTLPSAAFDRIRSHYMDRIESLGHGPNTPLHTKEAPSSTNHPLIQTEHTIWQDILEIEKKVVVDLRKSFKIGDDVMHEILRDIDLLHSRFK